MPPTGESWIRAKSQWNSLPGGWAREEAEVVIVATTIVAEEATVEDTVTEEDRPVARIVEEADTEAVMIDTMTTGVEEAVTEGTAMEVLGIAVPVEGGIIAARVPGRAVLDTEDRITDVVVVVLLPGVAPRLLTGGAEVPMPEEDVIMMIVVDVMITGPIGGIVPREDMGKRGGKLEKDVGNNCW